MSQPSPSDPVSAVSDPQLSAIAQIAINVVDVDRATTFYRDVLGLRFLFSGGPKMSFFDCGGVRLMLAVAEEPRFNHPSSILYFATADINASWNALIAGGASPERAPERLTVLGNKELWLAFFRDSEDNVLALSSEVPVTA